MKFTSEDLMKAMGLQVGDRVKTPNNITYLILKTNSGHIWVYDEIHNEKFLINYLVDTEFEILPKPKKVGQLTCREIKDCRTCPLWWICFIKINEKDEMKTSLYEMLDSFAVEDQEIYNLLKARLDKEVSE